MNARTIAILAYFSMPGWVLAMYYNSNHRTLLGSFHVRQALGVMSVGTLLLILSALSGSVEIVLSIFVLVFAYWLMGLIGAVRKSMKLLPILGYYFQKWFVGI